jgi:hypothetical protein
MITESELRERLGARLETSTHIKPQDLAFARSIAAMLVPMIMRIIRDEVREANTLKGEE